MATKTSSPLILSLCLACAPPSDGTGSESEAGDEDSESDVGADSESSGGTTSSADSSSTTASAQSTSESSSSETASTASSEGESDVTTSSSTSTSTSTESGESTSEAETEVTSEMHWVGTWGSGQQRITQESHFPPQSLTNNTLRQFVYTSIGGEEARLQLSNEYGDGPLTVNAVHIAIATQPPAIDASTDTEVTFSGSPSATLQPGEFLESDPIAFTVPEQASVAVTIHFGDTPATITGHPGSRTTSYIANGDGVSGTFDVATSAERWYYLTRLEVMAPTTSHAVVVLGDSLSDGRGSTTDGNDRWPDVMSRRLRANAQTADVAVINQGMGGNGILADGERPAGVDRFERDVLTQNGVRWVIVLAGINDIGYSNATAQQIIGAYERVIDEAHDAGLQIYGVPLLPCNGWSQVDSNPGILDIRQDINDWVRTSGRFDAVIELEDAVADSQDPSRLRSEFLFENDWLHLNASGYEAMGDAVPLDLFEG